MLQYFVFEIWNIIAQIFTPLRRQLHEIFSAARWQPCTVEYNLHLSIRLPTLQCFWEDNGISYIWWAYSYNTSLTAYIQYVLPSFWPPKIFWSIQAHGSHTLWHQMHEYVPNLSNFGAKSYNLYKFQPKKRSAVKLVTLRTCASLSVRSKNQRRRAEAADNRPSDWNTNVTTSAVGISARVVTCMNTIITRQFQ